MCSMNVTFVRIHFSFASQFIIYTIDSIHQGCLLCILWTEIVDRVTLHRYILFALKHFYLYIYIYNIALQYTEITILGDVVSLFSDIRDFHFSNHFPWVGVKGYPQDNDTAPLVQKEHDKWWFAHVYSPTTEHILSKSSHQKKSFSKQFCIEMEKKL